MVPSTRTQCQTVSPKRALHITCTPSQLNFDLNHNHLPRPPLHLVLSLVFRAASPSLSLSLTIRPPKMKVHVKRWHAIAQWRWDTGTSDPNANANTSMDDDDGEGDVCGICRVPYEGCCPGCKMPGDDCPLSELLSSSECLACVLIDVAMFLCSMGRVHACVSYALSA